MLISLVYFRNHRTTITFRCLHFTWHDASFIQNGSIWNFRPPGIIFPSSFLFCDLLLPSTCNAAYLRRKNQFHLKVCHADISRAIYGSQSQKRKMLEFLHILFKASICAKGAFRALEGLTAALHLLLLNKCWECIIKQNEWPFSFY